VDLYMVRVMYPVRVILRRAGFVAKIGEDHMWHTISQGVREARIHYGLKEGVVDASGGYDSEAEEHEPRIVPTYFAAYRHAKAELPHAVLAALQQAAELACGNVPEFSGPVLIGLDVSGSMHSPVTGLQSSGNHSEMSCVDAAALFASAVLRRNPDSVIVPFDDRTHDVRVDAGDTILSLADRLSQYGGGGTNCALPIEAANSKYANRSFAGVILVSDDQSWLSTTSTSGQTGVLQAWNAFVERQTQLGNRFGKPKLVCLDLAPYTTVQAPDREDILNVGGFGEAVFETVAGFLRGVQDCFVSDVEAIQL